MKEDESLRKNIVGCEKSRAPKRFGYASLYKEKRRLVFILYKMRQLRLVFADRETTEDNRAASLNSQHRERREDCLKKNLSISVMPMYNLVRVCVARNQIT